MNYESNVKISMLILLVLLTLSGFSQTSDSTTCIPNYQLREGVKLIEQGKIDAKIVQKQDSIIALYQQRIIKKDQQILGYMNNEKTFNALNEAYKKQIQLLQQSAQISSTWNTSLQKQLHRAHTKTVITGIAGILLSGVITYLAIK